MNTAASGLDGVARWATTGEIKQQPAVWRAFAPRIEVIAAEIKSWRATRDHDEVWFCGAGSSAFIGETLAAHLNRAPGPAIYRAVPTTDIVSSPTHYLRPGLKLLVVLFGRSGNSSESIGVLNLLAEHAPEADRLHITCNADSALGQSVVTEPGELRTIILPPQTNDTGFAMTSSYSTMLLTALACFDPAPPAGVSELFEGLAAAADAIIERGFAQLPARALPKRAVFLGAGPMTGSARESALKVMELTAGTIAALWDAPLGFRHGPKAFVKEETTVFVFLSPDPHALPYTIDLANEIAAQFGADAAVRVGDASAGADIEVPSVGNDAWGSVLFVLVAQMLAVIWSDRLRFNVDDPFRGRNLTRVVANVKLYPLPSSRPKLTGAIDLGGSKIETCLFDAKFVEQQKRRVATPLDSYAALLDALADEARWLETLAGSPLPIGIGMPGLVEQVTGVCTAANLPTTGHRLGADLAQRLGRPVSVENDCKCFALSEATGGAGSGYRTMFGMILGTGVGGGVCVDGKLVMGRNGLPGEVGHMGIPADLINRYRLPVVSCGCGRTGCYETLVAGPGMSRIALHLTGHAAEPAEIAAGVASGDPALGQVFDVWLELLAELLHTVQLTIDADCVVFGGGLSRIEGLADRIKAIFPHHRLPGLRDPEFLSARFGDASGVRGAAILACGATGGRIVQ